MDSAYEINTGKIIDAEELRLIDCVDPKGYTCRGCGILVSPCSYQQKNKVRPYFSAKDGHRNGCDIDGEAELIKRAKKIRVTTCKGFPGTFPNKLEIKSTRTVEAISSNIRTSLVANKYQNIADNNVDSIAKTRTWIARTIRPICRTFINFPYDRDLPLTISGISGTIYKYVFKRIKNQIIHYPNARIFYAPISWIKPITNDKQLEIKLNVGEWKNGQLIRPYRLRINWDDWSTAKRKYISCDLEFTRNEARKAKETNPKEIGWLFFIGKQDDVDLALFHVNEHRLICSLVAEIIYPTA